MKKSMKFLVLTMALCILAMSFAGCGNGESDAIVMGTNAEFPPFEYVTDKGVVGQFDGIDVAIAQEVAKKLGKELKVENMKFESLLMALSTDQIDFVAAGMTVRPDRQENADFSDTYYTAKQVMIVNEASDIKSAEDLKNGKKVGVMTGYTGDTVISDMGIEPQRFMKGTDAVMELKNGKIDAVVIDSTPAEAFVDQNEGLKIVEDGKAFENEEYAIAVKKGNTELLNAINEVLKELKESGKIKEISEKYIQAQ